MWLSSSQDGEGKGVVLGVSVLHHAYLPPIFPQNARVYVSTNNGSVVNSVIVRPWFDMVTDLQAKVFATGTPSQRQQLFCGEGRLHDDGRVIALQGVTSESTIQLVSAVTVS